MNIQTLKGNPMKFSPQDLARLDELHEYVWNNQPEMGTDPIETMWQAVKFYFQDIDDYYNKLEGENVQPK